ncbi:PEP-dependent dihydroxyacetone kinase ADP-binding subunit DhaL [termite gut metagenome]|uniref:PEP-dependent dihydroxyacetone kinase ADP-binding subunit DhaL n=1 Tax=termite gut metagenome TaxID=433724 RepID=A0A5J4RKE8_9ZZZZ
MDKFTNASAIAWLKALSATYQEKKDYLTALDSQIGDADHGTNLSRGFAAVDIKLDTVADKDLGTILKTVAMTLISTVGGASGPLYGSFFLQASTAVSGQTSVDKAGVGKMLDAGLASVMARGKANLGEKTMIDAMLPAVKAFNDSPDDLLTTALVKASEAARKGAEATIPLVATKGRASYLGERSAGHKDPGSESTAMLFETLSNALK